MKKIFLPLLITCSTYCVHAQNEKTIKGAQMIPVTLERISPSLSELPNAPLPGPDDKQLPMKEHEQPSLPKQNAINEANALKAPPDASLQKNYMDLMQASASASILSSWAGLTGSATPSDNSIAVGTNHVMQMVNSFPSSFIRIWNKSGTVLVNSITAESITGFKGYGDGDLLYDQQADRYLFVMLYSSSSNKLIVAISKTGDPTGAFYIYTFRSTDGFPDYPKIGVWGNSYFITANSNNESVYALNKTAMLAGNTLGSAQLFKITRLSANLFQSAAPVSQTGATAPPANSSALVMRIVDGTWGGSGGADHLDMFSVHVDWSNSANSTITGPTKLNITSYNGNMSSITQKGSNTKLDNLAGILMDKVQYRNFGSYESIVCSAPNNAGSGVAGAEWFELRKNGAAAWVVYQQGTYSPTSTDHRWQTSISINANGTIALGYNIAGSGKYPSIRLTGRNAGDALNTMTVAETTVKDGTSSNNSNRWGDYSSMLTDPVDGSFWMGYNYNPTANWGTNVTHFTIVASQLVGSGEEPSVRSITSLSASPNPAANQVSVSFDAKYNQKTTIQLLNLSNKAMVQQQMNATEGRNQVMLNVHDLENGYYILKLNTNEGSISIKVLIQH